MIQKLAFSMLPLLLASNQLQLTEEDIKNNRNYYEVIGATTGEKIEEKLYASQRLIETHIKSVSAIKKALANEGIDPASVRVLLYYDGLTIDDSLLPRMWQTKTHPNTISSPWLDLTRTVTTSGETRITIRIDATAARLLKDLYSEDKYKESGFLSIPSIEQSCYFKVSNEYEKYDLDKKIAVNKTRKIYNCVPKKLREPLLSLFQTSEYTKIANFSSFSWGVHNQLFMRCQDKVEKYYEELYPQLAIRGLQILESEFDPTAVCRFMRDSSSSGQTSCADVQDSLNPSLS